MRNHGIEALLCAAIALFGIVGTVSAQEETVSLKAAKRAFGSDDSHYRHETIKRLNAEDPSHYKFLVTILKKGKWYDREAAIKALAGAALDDTLQKMVEDLQDNKSVFVRQGMAWALAQMNASVEEEGEENEKKKEFVEVEDKDDYYAKLYPALNDKSEWVRRTVAHVLRVEKRRGAVNALIQRFVEEEDPVVATFIEQSLNELTQVYHGSDPAAWHAWWTEAQSDETYKLGKTDAESLRKAEELGKKIKDRSTGVASAGLDGFLWSERGTDIGVPILILPHYGYSQETMLPFLAHLEKNHKLFYINLPPIDSFKNLEKAGESDMPYYPIDKLVEAFEGLRKDRKVKRFAIMACGMNGWIAMRYAQRYPKSVAAMILVAPISGSKQYGMATDVLLVEGQKRRDYEMWHLGMTRRFNPQTGEGNHEKYHRENELKKRDGEAGSISRRAWSLHFKEERDFVIATLYPKRRHEMGNVAIPDFSLFKEKQPKRPVPVLIFVGTHSLFSSVGDCKQIQRHYKGSKLVVMKQSSQMPFAEESVRFNKNVLAFLQKSAPVKKKKKDKDDD